MTHIAPSNNDYERRQIVAKMGKAGHFVEGGKKYIIWQYMTFWTGHMTPAICATFVRPATIKDGFIQLDDLKPGELVVKPGLIYQKIPMSGMIMAEHLKAMKYFRPRDILQSYKDTAAGAVDLGKIDLSGMTKQ